MDDHRAEPDPDPAWRGWDSVLAAPRATIALGRSSDTRADRARGGPLQPAEEALFTQSNARVLLGHAANGSLRLVALPTRVYPAPTAETELGLGPGIYHRFEVAMYLADLAWTIEIEGGTPVELGTLEGTTTYVDGFLPVTEWTSGDLALASVSIAPVAVDAAEAPLAPAPLPGPAGVLHVLRLHNTGPTPMSGRVRCRVSDLLLEELEDAEPSNRTRKRPVVDVRQGTLLLSRPGGGAGVHLHGGSWTRLEAPFEAERAFELGAGQELVLEAHIGLGATVSEVLPVVYELHRRTALEWLELTRAFWHARVGTLAVDGDPEGGASLSRELYLRTLWEQLDCVQTDAQGDVVAVWQGAPSAGHGLVWGIDIEPTAVALAHVSPELAWRLLLFFATRSRAPRGGTGHSTPILVGPLVVARRWLEVTGDADAFGRHPWLLERLAAIVEEVLACRSDHEPLFASRYSSDGSVGRRYDLGTNIKVAYALEGWSMLLAALGREDEGQRFRTLAAATRDVMERTMVVEGPFGAQYSGGTNLGEPPGPLHLPDGVAYYDGEDTTTMLAPELGACTADHGPWVRYHRFARSLWCPNHDPEMDVLRWAPSEQGVFDGAGYLSRLGGSVSVDEMEEALSVLRELGLDHATGSIHWWPRGLEHPRTQSRCSQGQGAYAWLFLERWLGIHVDALRRMVTLAPRGPVHGFAWEGFDRGRFDIAWSEAAGHVSARVTNHDQRAWTVRVGIRPSGWGTTEHLTWHERAARPGEEVAVELAAPADADGLERGWTAAVLREREAAAFGDAERIVFRRFGPATLWGHWDGARQFDPGAMPFALRFLVGNHTDEDWSDVRVRVVCPPGWRAQGRQPRHWTPDDDLREGTVDLRLGPVAAGDRTVAPFWLRGPETWPVRFPWLGDAHGLHEDTQPGPGLLIRTTAAGAAGSWTLDATLEATTRDGRTVSRRLEVPLRVTSEEG